MVEEKKQQQPLIEVAAAHNKGRDWVCRRIALLTGVA